MPRMLQIKHIEWLGDATTGHLRLLDQTKLPTEQVYLDCTTVQHVWDAIKRLSVRGAPAIGIAAAYACVLAVQQRSTPGAADSAAMQNALNAAADHLANSRPTAVNLVWALKRMQRAAADAEPLSTDALLAEARDIHEQDAAMCRRIGEHGLALIKRCITAERPGVLTHCNAGALATGGIGTATAPMYLAREQNLPLQVFADETRPLLQGSRLTAFELAAAGVDVTIICDDMAAQVMRENRIGMVITGADRVAANGDAANKIGTYNLAVLADHHRIPFFIAAPSSTFDLQLDSGDDIPIEQRGSEEITQGFGKRTAPDNVKTYSPAFDVTPHELITAIVTERGVIEPVNTDTVRAMVGD